MDYGFDPVSGYGVGAFDTGTPDTSGMSDTTYPMGASATDSGLNLGGIGLAALKGLGAGQQQQKQPQQKNVHWRSVYQAKLQQALSQMQGMKNPQGPTPQSSAPRMPI
jgi:hypothetical protein